MEGVFRRAILASMQDQAARAAATETEPEPSSRARAFYKVWLPLGIFANLGLGVFVLADLGPTSWTDWLQVGTGAFCCMVAGWLTAALWSKVYWNRSMARQVAVWRRIADAFFTWVEDAPLPAEAVHRLKVSLDQVVPTKEGNHSTL
ncbi:MAG TPA: hypothetical protein VJR46_11090 [Candidatus Dormibacteraeota bacterium]|nr:hypothetical protein [Candidatus Dormibacteraeota bacterium]